MLAAFGLTITNPGVFFGFLAIFGTMNAVLRLNEAGHGRPRWWRASSSAARCGGCF